MGFIAGAGSYDFGALLASAVEGLMVAEANLFKLFEIILAHSQSVVSIR